MPHLADGTPYAPGSDTSRDAAVKQSGAKKRGDAIAIALYYINAGKEGATSDQVTAELKIQYATCTARINELVKGGILIRTQGRRRTRTGATASVLVHRDHLSKQ